MRFKKIIASVLIATTFLGLVGCGATEDTSAPATQDETVIPEATEEVVAVEDKTEEESQLTVQELDAVIKEAFEVDSDERDHDQVKELCNQAIEMGSGYAMYVMSCEYILDENYEKALELAQNAVDNNEPLGYITLAYCYQYGLGVETNAKEAYIYAINAMENGVAFGLAIMGDLCSGEYEGMERDDGTMYGSYAGYCITATENIEYIYYYKLASCYLNGTGTGQNTSEAMNWFEKSADAGYLPSAWACGTAYLYGNLKNNEGTVDIDIDYAKALKYFEIIINSNEDITSYINSDLYVSAGNAALMLKDWDKTRTYCEKSIELGEPSADGAQIALDYMDENGL